MCRRVNVLHEAFQMNTSVNWKMWLLWIQINVSQHLQHTPAKIKQSVENFWNRWTRVYWENPSKNRPIAGFVDEQKGDGASKTNKKRACPIYTVYTVFRLLPGGERVEFPLEELEDKCQEVGMKLYQRWQSRSRERVTRDLTGHAITEGIHAQRQRVNIYKIFFFSIFANEIHDVVTYNAI